MADLETIERVKEIDVDKYKYGFKTDIEYVPWGQCQEKATTLSSAGNPAAIAYMGSRTLKQLAANDLILSHDLSDESVVAFS